MTLHASIRTRLPLAIIAGTFLSVSTVPVLAEDATLRGEKLFANRVLDIFQTKCFVCHGDDAEKLRGEFNMLSLDGLLRGGESKKPAIVPGRPEESPLYQAVRWQDLEMPPKENDRLTAEQTDTIKEWILAGAPWPDEKRQAELLREASSEWNVTNGVTVQTSGGLSDEWTQRQYDPNNLWPYQPLSVDENAGWAEGTGNPIDWFINRGMSELGLEPAPAADRRTLLRRATFDLIGLPPTPEEVTTFLDDPLPDDQAFGKVIERLLASPHYGEQWARHWLDVVRYADSSGYANDFERGNAWRYRDYVVRAFNEDKPYDQFVREQIAGDEIDESNEELLIAAGFLRMGPWELTGMEVPKVARQRFLDDVTDAVGQVFLGHMLQCARCHDHKFDPIPTRDYYSMQAIFATTQLTERKAAFLASENREGFEEKEYFQKRKAFYQRTLKALDKKHSVAAALAWYQEKGRSPDGFTGALVELQEKAKNPKRVFQKLIVGPSPSEKPQGTKAEAGDVGSIVDAGQQSHGALQPGEARATFESPSKKKVTVSEVRKLLQKRKVHPDLIPPKLVGFGPEDFGLERIARKGIQRLNWCLQRYEPVAFSVYSGRTPKLKNVAAPLAIPKDPMKQGELEETAVLAGGDPFSPTTPVTPGVLSTANSLSQITAADVAIPTGIVGRRRALAEWIVSERNPLTARVMVNRIWQWHFTQAIAGNPNNFGTTGKKPSHPDLLDWLAQTFVKGGWSVKAMHRHIMSSQVYRRASGHPEPKTLASQDPEGVSYAVFTPRRLEAEELRDAMLEVSGELNPTIGGIPVRPEMNMEAALQARQVMGTFAEAWQPSPLPRQRHRRSLYALRLRGHRDPFLEVFDAPAPNLSCEAREASNITPQIFALFNSELSFDRAIAMAMRVLKEDLSGVQTIDRLFRLAFGRVPGSEETAACLAHWQEMTARHQEMTFAPKVYPTEVVREAVEENTGERFVFTEPLEMYADFVPDVKAADVGPKVRGLAEVCLVLLNSNEFAYVY